MQCPLFAASAIPTKYTTENVFKYYNLHLNIWIYSGYHSIYIVECLSPIVWLRHFVARVDSVRIDQSVNRCVNTTSRLLDAYLAVYKICEVPGLLTIALQPV